VNLSISESANGQEVYTVGSKWQRPASNTPHPERRPAAVVEEEEDLSVKVQPGTRCRHNGCTVVFESDEVNRLGEGKGTVCTYHPSTVRPEFNFLLVDVHTDLHRLRSLYFPASIP
jgi:hypothetical protein